MLKARYRPDIDGLRAIAILAVVAFHGFPNLVPGGFVGVDVFFVISGFLISGILFNDLASNNFHFFKFYGRRIRRIFPALILILVASLAAGWIFFLATNFEDLCWQVLSSSLFASNVFFWQQSGYFDTAADGKPLLHLWSLGVEEQFYILWPVLLYAAHKFRWNKLFVIAGIFVLSLAINIAFVTRAPIATFYLPFSRLWELALGGLIAYAFWLPRMRAALHGQVAERITLRTIRDIAGIAGMTLIVYSALHFTVHDKYPGLRALYPTSGAALLIFSGRRSLINEVLATRLFVFIGLVSYPLYMWHWPLLAFFRDYSTASLTPTDISVILSLSFVLAWLTYVWIEKPIRLNSNNQGRISQRLLAALFCIALLSCIGVLMHGVPQRLPPMLRILDKKLKDDWTTSHWHKNCFTGPGGGFPDECVDREPKGAPLVALLGDSQAASLYPGIRELQKTHKFRLAETTVSSCPFILNYSNPVRPSGGADLRNLCNAGNKAALERIKPLHPSTVIMLDAWWYYYITSESWNPVIENELKATIEALKASGIKRIILMGPTPTWDPKPLVRLLSDAWQKHPALPLPTRMSEGLSPVLSQINASLKKIAQQENIIYVAPMDHFCNAEGCLTRLGDGPDDITTWDAGHLTPVASIYLMKAIEPILLGNAD